MSKTADKQEPMVSRGLSMRPVHYIALGWLAVRSGHLSRSRSIQELIDREMERRLGKDWESRITSEEAA